jgi:hypothetical protein
MSPTFFTSRSFPCFSLSLLLLSVSPAEHVGWRIGVDAAVVVV